MNQKNTSFGLANMNGISDDSGRSCALDDMNCRKGQPEQSPSLQDMNAANAQPDEHELPPRLSLRPACFSGGAAYFASVPGKPAKRRRLICRKEKSRSA